MSSCFAGLMWKREREGGREGGGEGKCSVRANVRRSILFAAGRGYMSDLRDAFAAGGVWRQAGCCGKEEEEAEEGAGGADRVK